MCENIYPMAVMRGARLYKKFEIIDEDFKFTDYNIKMEIKDGLYGTSLIFLNDSDFVITDTTFEISIGASTTRTFPEEQTLNYGIEFIDKNDSENVIEFLTGTIYVKKEIPGTEEA